MKLNNFTKTTKRDHNQHHSAAVVYSFASILFDYLFVLLRFVSLNLPPIKLMVSVFEENV